MIDGLAIVDKPAGMTSHDVVGRLRKVFAQKRVGHAGTLDPDATGVLVVGLGRVTRLMQYMSGLGKSYTTEIVLGSSTTTLDDSGEVTGTWDMSGVTIDDARRAARSLTGPISQVPPMVSAVKIGGRRLHELARAGIEVERPARPVTVHRFDLEAAGPADTGPADTGPADTGQADTGQADTGPVLAARVDCSSGTYIRVLADDLGRLLGGGAHVRRLRRVAVGPWRVEDATPLEEIGPDDLIRPADALPWLAATVVTGETESFVRHGRVLPIEILAGEGAAGDGPDGGPWRVLDGVGHLLAVYESHKPGLAKPTVVLDGPPGG